VKIWDEIFGKVWKTPGKTLGEAVAEATGGANLVNGKQTWELVAEWKHDIEMMKRCCSAENRNVSQDRARAGAVLFRTSRDLGEEAQGL
jgi:hypothetical protein